QRAAHDHSDLRLRRRARRVCRGDGGADLQRLAQHGLGADHRGVRGGGDRRHGLDSRRYRHRLWAGRDRGLDQGVFPGSIEHGYLRDHGDRLAGASCRPVRAEGVMERVVDPLTKKPSALRQQSETIGFIVMVTALVIAPFVTYPLFVMQALCFALFACAFNLLIGYVGLLSFGHALYFGWASYLSAYSAKVWGFPPELAILTGTATGAVCGLIAGSLAIRRQGIYFAMITLALAQMMYFFAVQAKFTGGEDGIQAVPRGHLFGLIDLRNEMAMYALVLVIFLAGFMFIYRIIHSPFGEVLKAIRENEMRAISLGYKTDRYKL